MGDNEEESEYEDQYRAESERKEHMAWGIIVGTIMFVCFLVVYLFGAK